MSGLLLNQTHENNFFTYNKLLKVFHKCIAKLYTDFTNIYLFSKYEIRYSSKHSILLSQPFINCTLQYNQICVIISVLCFRNI